MSAFTAMTVDFQTEMRELQYDESQISQQFQQSVIQ